jgi:hypothetical protein
MLVGVEEGRLDYYNCTNPGGGAPTYNRVPDTANPFKAFDGLGTFYVPIPFDVDDDVSVRSIHDPRTVHPFTVCRTLPSPRRSNSA